MVVLCCLALFIVSPLLNHVQLYTAGAEPLLLIFCLSLHLWSLPLPLSPPLPHNQNQTITLISLASFIFLHTCIRIYTAGVDTYMYMYMYMYMYVIVWDIVEWMVLYQTEIAGCCMGAFWSPLLPPSNLILVQTLHKRMQPLNTQWEITLAIWKWVTSNSHHVNLCTCPSIFLPPLRLYRASQMMYEKFIIHTLMPVPPHNPTPHTTHTHHITTSTPSHHTITSPPPIKKHHRHNPPQHAIHPTKS